jgi:transcriptional regulator of nitric oxide reductase
MSIPSLPRLAAMSLLVAASSVLLSAGQAPDARQSARLRRLFPTATAFSPKGGEPPHYKVYSGQGSEQRVVGYAFWTTEVVPLERGYGGPIAILIGLESTGKLSGVIVGDHREPYGDFSIERPEFAAGFAGKDIRDPFKLGGDVDAVSRATITMSAAVRAIRTAARRMAREHLTPPAK